MWVSKREWDFMERQLEYWQAQAEKERDRADRALDQISLFQGQLPISDLGLKSRKEISDADKLELADRRAQLQEIFADVMDSATEDETGLLN